MKPIDPFSLVPLIYRELDAPAGNPLRMLMQVVGRTFDALHLNAASTYDAWFIETCPGWVVPYIGTLIGEDLQEWEIRACDPRARIGNAVRYRRGNGRLDVLASAIDAYTSWPALVVSPERWLARTADVQGGPQPQMADVERPRLARSFPAVEPVRVGERIGPSTGPPTGLGPDDLKINVYRYMVVPVTRAGTRAVGACLRSFDPGGLETPLMTAPLEQVPARLSPEALDAELTLARGGVREAGHVGEGRLYGPGRALCLWRDASASAAQIPAYALRVVSADEVLSAGPRRRARLGGACTPPDRPVELSLRGQGAGEQDQLLLRLPRCGSPEEVASRLEQALRALPGGAWRQARVLCVDGRLALIAGSGERRFDLASAPADPTGCALLGLEAAAPIGAMIARPLRLSAEPASALLRVGEQSARIEIGPWADRGSLATALEAALRGSGLAGTDSARVLQRGEALVLLALPGDGAATGAPAAWIFEEDPEDPTGLPRLGLGDWIGVDPPRGLLVLPLDRPDLDTLAVDWVWGAPGLLGAGFSQGEEAPEGAVQAPPQDLGAALAAAGQDSAFALADDRDWGALSLRGDTTIVALEGRVPVLGHLDLPSEGRPMVRLRGLRLTRGIRGGAADLTLSNCTVDGPIRLDGGTLTVERCVLGRLELAEGARLEASDSVIEEIAATDGTGCDAKLDQVTVLSDVVCNRLTARRCVLAGPARVRRPEEGELAFCVTVPCPRGPHERFDNHVPQEPPERWFLSSRRGDPAYAQLTLGGPATLAGPDEPGAYALQRRNLRLRLLRKALRRHLRSGLEAAITFVDG